MLPTSILKLFGRSPINPIQEHMSKSHKCAAELLPFFEAIQKEDWTKARKQQQKIAALEHEADVVKRDIRLHLPKNLFLPVSRNDILELLISQDSVANCTKDIAGLVIGRKMVFPREIAQHMLKFVKKSIEASAQAAKAISELSELVESGFRGNELKIAKDMIKKLDQIENESDDLQIKIRDILFEIEKDLPPIDVMFMYKIIDWVGDLADRAQHVGGKLQLLMAR